MSVPPLLSIVVCFHEMRREAPRTLSTLQAGYQRGVDGSEYEVIAVDNGSTLPVEGRVVAGFGERFQLWLEAERRPSPCVAINRAVRAAQGEFVMICIDGARMHSPGTLFHSLRALALHPRPFVYTLGMHLGPKPQNESMVDGYGRDAEDALLDSIDWRGDGYRLFDVSSVAYSSRQGFLSRLTESNCFTIRREDYLALGGLDERFEGPGGGLVNLDFFNLVHEQPRMQPIMLLGEATFHQFHGGVAANATPGEHPMKQMAEEYRRIRGKPFASAWRAPQYFGALCVEHHARLLSFG